MRVLGRIPVVVQELFYPQGCLKSQRIEEPSIDTRRQLLVRCWSDLSVLLVLGSY
jgi:hypothetical protein